MKKISNLRHSKTHDEQRIRNSNHDFGTHSSHSKYAKNVIPGPILKEKDQPFMDKRAMSAISEGFYQSRIDSRFQQEGVQIQKVPKSHIAQSTKRSNQRIRSKMRSNSAALSRGCIYSIDNSNAKENKVKPLNKAVMAACMEFEQVYTSIFFSKKSSQNSGKDIGWFMKEYCLIWKHYYKLNKLLQMYKPILGLSVNFAPGSSIFFKLKSILGYGKNLIDNLSKQEFKGLAFSHLWGKTFLVFLEYLEQLAKILSLNKPVRIVFIQMMKVLQKYYKSTLSREIRNKGFLKKGKFHFYAFQKV